MTTNSSGVTKFLSRLQPVCALSEQRRQELAGQSAVEWTPRGKDPFRPHVMANQSVWLLAGEIKLDLAIILVVGGLLLLVQGRLLDSLLAQLLVLASYGVLGMLWILIRTRKVLQRSTRGQEPRPNGPL